MILHYRYKQIQDSTSRGGAVIFNSTKSKVLLIKIPGHNKYSFPKGKKEYFWESLRLTAKREVMEETGINLPLKLFQDGKKLSFRCRKYFAELYIIDNISEKIKITPGNKYEVESVHWMDVDLIASNTHMLTHEHKRARAHTNTHISPCRYTLMLTTFEFDRSGTLSTSSKVKFLVDRAS